MNAADILDKLLTPPVTLAKLAAEGKFASVPLGLPLDVQAVDWEILFEGEPTDYMPIEIYAPGDESGWAVVTVPAEDGSYCGQTELIRGRWELSRKGHDFNRDSGKDDKVLDGEAPCGVYGSDGAA